MTGLTYLRMYVYNLYIIIILVQYYHTRRMNFQRCCITSRIIIRASVYGEDLDAVYILYYIYIML